MEHKIYVMNFGPIKNTELDITSFLYMIGPQSSGKSTVAKLVYFYLHVRDELVAYLIDKSYNIETDIVSKTFKKRLRNRFVEFFGPTPNVSDIYIRYYYTKDIYITTKLDSQYKYYVNHHFSEKAWQKIIDLAKKYENSFRYNDNTSYLTSKIGKITYEKNKNTLLNNIRDECFNLFNYDKELFFVPAGRSLLSTIPDQLQNIHHHLLDFPMRQFIETVNSTKNIFTKPLDEIITDRKALTTSNLWTSVVNDCKYMTRKILKGEYIHDREGGKLYVSENFFTKINYSSSGQQESVWILLSLFLLALDQTQSFVVIEEPEAHLFPSAQKNLLEYIAYIYNKINCDFVITTHSPFITEYLNNLMYAHDLSYRTNKKHISQVISKSYWINPYTTSGYYVNESGTLETLRMENSILFENEYLDNYSYFTNEELDKLIDIERSL